MERSNDEYLIQYYRPILKYKLKPIKIKDSDRKKKIMQLINKIKSGKYNIFTFLHLKELTNTSLSDL